jgi:formate/nitrite transporter FocA (FNT family)
MPSFRHAILFLLLGSAAGFSPAASGMTKMSSIRSRLSAATIEETDEGFDILINKNKEGATRDYEERSERISLDITKTQYTSLVKSPPDAYITFAEKGASNAHLPKRKIFHQSILGGCYVGFGGLISLMIAGNLGGISGANPGVAKMAFAALFPVNLLLIVSTQGQLFTGNSATVAAAKYEGFVTWKDLISNWTISLGGNIVGCTLFAAATMVAQVLNPGATALCLKTAVGKCGAGFVPTLVRAIMCNWMVSMAVFLSGAANDLTGKMVGCWFPMYVSFHIKFVAFQNLIMISLFLTLLLFLSFRITALLLSELDLSTLLPTFLFFPWP